VSKLSHGLDLPGWRVLPNSNLVLNCAGSSRCFLRQKLQEGMRVSLLELAKGPCASFVRTDDILIKVRNQKEECRTWSLIATTSQVLALRLSLHQTLMSISLSLFVSNSCLISLNSACISSTLNQVYSLVRIYHRAMSLWFRKCFPITIPL
jgi:hypothetical protein